MPRTRSVYNNWRPYRAYPGANFIARVGGYPLLNGYPDAWAPVDSPNNELVKLQRKCLEYEQAMLHCCQATNTGSTMSGKHQPRSST